MKQMEYSVTVRMAILREQIGQALEASRLPAAVARLVLEDVAKAVQRQEDVQVQLELQRINMEMAAGSDPLSRCATAPLDQQGEPRGAEEDGDSDPLSRCATAPLDQQGEPKKEKEEMEDGTLQG